MTDGGTDEGPLRKAVSALESKAQAWHIERGGGPLGLIRGPLRATAAGWAALVRQYLGHDPALALPELTPRLRALLAKCKTVDQPEGDT